MRLLRYASILGFCLLTCCDPAKTTSHPYDSFRRDDEACIKAWSGGDPFRFDHLWILSSPDLEAWWDPNGMRAEANLILDTGDRVVIDELLSQMTLTSRSSPNHERTLPTGRIYHALIFSTSHQIYAHLRFAYRSGLSDGTTVFNVVTDFDGSTPVKDCPDFTIFENQHLTKTKTGEQAVDGNPH